MKTGGSVIILAPLQFSHTLILMKEREKRKRLSVYRKKEEIDQSVLLYGSRVYITEELVR